MCVFEVLYCTSVCGGLCASGTALYWCVATRLFVAEAQEMQRTEQAFNYICFQESDNLEAKFNFFTVFSFSPFYFFLHVYSTQRLTSYCTHRMTPSCQVGGTKVWLGCGDRFVTKLLPETRWDVRFSVSMQSGRHMHRAVRMSQSLGLAAVSLFPGPTSLNSSLKRPSLACYNPLVAANPEQRAAVEAIVSGVSRPAPVSILSTHLIRPIFINLGKG